MEVLQCSASGGQEGGYVKKTQKAPIAEINKAKKIKRAVEKGSEK